MGNGLTGCSGTRGENRDFKLQARAERREERKGEEKLPQFPPSHRSARAR